MVSITMMDMFKLGRDRDDITIVDVQRYAKGLSDSIMNTGPCCECNHAGDTDYCKEIDCIFLRDEGTG